MSSKFISSSGAGDLSVVLNGSLNIHGASLSSTGLIPNMPVKTDTASKKLVSSKISVNDLNEPLSQFVQETTDKTLFIQLPLSNDGTHFSNNVTAKKFILDGATSENKAYLMSDGTTSTASSNGQPNIYLFLNSQNIASPATAGQIRTNNARNDLSTRVYISLITRDNVNIGVFLNQISTTSVLYMQDQTTSSNNVRFNVIGTPIVYPSYIDVPVQYFSGSGTGDIELGNNSNIFMSIFTNDLAVDIRLSSLETKTGLQQATNTITRFSNTLIVDSGYPIYPLDEIKLGVSDEIKVDMPLNKFEVSDAIRAYIPLDLGNNDINNAGLYNGCDVNAMKDLVVLNTNAISAKLDKNTADGLYAPITNFNYLTTSEASSTYLAKTDATLYATTSSLSNYLTSASADKYLTKTISDGLYPTITDLATTNGNVATLSSKTQNLSGTFSYSQFSKPLDMMTNVIDNVGTPLINVHAANKLYVDTEIIKGIASKLNINGTNSMTGDLNMNTKNITNAGIITASKFSTNGLSTEFLKANGDIDGNEYLTTASALTTYGKLTDLNAITTTVSAHTNSISSLSTTRLNINGNNAMQADLDVGTHKVINVSEPTAPTDATTRLYVDTASATKLSIDGSNSMTGILNMNTYNINNVGVINATEISLTSGTPAQFLKGDGSLDGKSYVEQSGVALTNSAVAFINSSGQLSSSASNLYVQKGVNTIQSALNAVVNNSYSSIQLSSSVFIETVVLIKSNYTLVGPAHIFGNMTFGVLGIDTDNISIKDVVVAGNLTFITDITYHGLKHYFSGCEFQGGVIFPTAPLKGGQSITFVDCVFSGSSAITFHNILNNIYFIRCEFKGQTITNNQLTSARLVFRNCRGLPTLSLGNCVKVGLNESVSGSSSFTLVDSTNTALLRADGTTDANTYLTTDLASSTYPTITSGSFAVQWTGGAGGTTHDRNIEWRRISDGIITTVWLKLTAFSVTIGTANSNFGVLMTTATVPANLSVLGQPCLPLITVFNNVVQCGWLVHYGTTLGIQNSAKGTALAGTVCGIPQTAIVSYMI